MYATDERPSRSVVCPLAHATAAEQKAWLWGGQSLLLPLVQLNGTSTRNVTLTGVERNHYVHYVRFGLT